MFSSERGSGDSGKRSKLYTSFFAICSSRISCTVRATMTLWLRLKEDSISCNRIRRIIERHEKAFLAILAHHHGFKGVYVRAAGLVLLLYLDGIPAFFQAEFAVLLLARRGAGRVIALRWAMTDGWWNVWFRPHQPFFNPPVAGRIVARR
jgi:hypothetical protein